ncbi:MAG: NAD-dependent epimerase/dehydratase family protein [Acidimicrobiales bacterium]
MILVTGSNGFLGSAVVRRLAETTSTAIRCLVRPGSSTARIDDLIDTGRVELYQGTLNSDDDCRGAIDGVDTIYHLAAGMGGGAMADVWLTTVVATDKLLRAIDVRRADDGAPLDRFVHCSSFAVYGVASMEAGATVDESTPLETDRRSADDYAHAKLRQEELVRAAAEAQGFDLVVVRPGVVYGPGGGGLSRRIGIRQGDLIVAMGGRNILPLSYVDNCAEAMVLVGSHPDGPGQVINIHDDDLISAKEFLARYRAEAEPLKTVPLPKPATRALAGAVLWYHRRSKGHLPAAITPHMYRTQWVGHRFDNAKLKSFGWRQTVTTDEGLARSFAAVAKRRQQQRTADGAAS